MYSRLTLFKKYVHHMLYASNGKGHGVHSPFVFDFITKVLQDKKQYPIYQKIELLRTEMLQNSKQVMVEDLGAGGISRSPTREIKAIAGSSLKNKKLAQLLFRIVKYYSPSTIIELGTSLGITTCYLAAGNPGAEVYTFEGAKNIASVAIDNFEKNNFGHIHMVVGNFNTTLAVNLNRISAIDLAFIDGNHRRIPTLDYFDTLLKKSGNQSIFIFDDIHWSSEMELAWRDIQQHPAVSLTIDLFFMGLVFLRRESKVKQHFSIRF